MRKYTEDVYAQMDAEKRDLQEIGANWKKDSSLEAWFPLTAQELDKLRLENKQLKKQLANKEKELDLLSYEIRDLS